MGKHSRHALQRPIREIPGRCANVQNQFKRTITDVATYAGCVANTRPSPIQTIRRASSRRSVRTASPGASCSTGTSPAGVAMSVPGRTDRYKR
jgi:hypothetical protein